MAWQLIYTSAPRGLLTGQSGFCTVARSADLRDALAQRLEQLSAYHYLRVAEAANPERNPAIGAFRILDVRGTKYHVLTRIQPCGWDFTARTNHIAHHLVFEARELGLLPSPAALLNNWTGWMRQWQGEPRHLPDVAVDTLSAAARFSLPAETWLRLTGDAGRAAGLLEVDRNRGCTLVCPVDSEKAVLSLYCESLQLLNITGQYALRPWRHTFTSFLQIDDNPADFQWRACQENSPAHQEAVRRGLALTPLAAVKVPLNSLAKVAREGHKPPTVPSQGSAPALWKPPTGPTVPRSEWESEEEEGSEGAGFLHVRTGTLRRIAVAVVIVLGLLGLRFWLGRNHAPTEQPQVQAPPPPPVAAKPVPAPPTVSNTTLNPEELRILSGDGPLFLLPSPDMQSCSIPVEANLRLQKMLNRFDKLETLPNQMRVSLNTDGWALASAAPLTVGTRQSPLLPMHTAAGQSVSLDYSRWLADPHAPALMQEDFPAAKAILLQFAFETPADGDPFRLLLVNETNAPPPLRLPLHWLRSGATTFAGSLEPGLLEVLSAQYLLPGNWQWQLFPAVSGKDGQPRLLYKDWPIDQWPAPGEELNFSGVRQRLAAQLKPLQDKLSGANQQVTAQIRAANLGLPLGHNLGLTDAKLTSFASTGNPASRIEFADYLNTLKKRVKLKQWPRIDADDDESELPGKFQQLTTLLIEKDPALKATLIVGNGNYFASVWMALQTVERSRREAARLRAEVDKLQERLNLMPEALDKVAYVGLYMTTPGKTGLELIRFEARETTQ